MKIHSLHDNAVIEMTRCGSEFTPGSRDAAVNVHVTSANGFSARLKEVWFERDSTITPFLEDLKAFINEERESATLTDFPFPGRSPTAEYNEFRLNLLRLGSDVFAFVDLAAVPAEGFRPELGSHRLRVYLQCRDAPPDLLCGFEKLFDLSQ